jgi:biotin operon repressor
MPAAAHDARPPDGDVDPAYLARLYECEGLSTCQIAEFTGISRQRVTRALRRIGVPVRSRGAGRRRPTRRQGDPPDVQQLITRLYEETRLSSHEISALLGIPERTIRERLHRYGVQVRTRGSWSREQRGTVPAELLIQLYVQLGLPAEAVRRQLGTSGRVVLRSAHAYGLPVRTRGTFAEEEPEEIELIDALYGDPLVAAALRQYGIPRIPAGGPIYERFPIPIALTAPLVKELYWACGIGLSHIELVTGQPAVTVQGFMHRSGIPLRHPGGRTPFIRRWRAAARRAVHSSAADAAADERQ